ncbi:hypothetical protein P7C71_g404, partial [Lecanoromycetidae sp. Uapishka_2]
MLIPLSRRTLIIVPIFLFFLWYLDRINYLPDISSSIALAKARAGLITKPDKPSSSLGNGVSPNITFDESPAPGVKEPRPVQSGQLKPKERFTSGQKVFGSRVFHQKYPLKTFAKFNHGLPLDLPKCQHDFKQEDESEGAKVKRLGRLAAVKKSFEHSWQGYKEHAWLKDELSPLDGKSTQSFSGWAATLVDTLDTLWIMGMKKDFEEAVHACRGIDFSTTTEDEINIFETTIRYLGGFLGAYDLSDGAYPVLLDKAVEVGELIYVAFDTPNHMPATHFKWREVLEGGDQTASENTLIAEIGSLSLEFTRLSQLTGDMKYFDAVQRILEKLDSAQSETKIPGLWPTVMNAKAITFQSTGFTLGAMADSLYEYLPKLHMLLGGRGDLLKHMYDYSITAAMNHVFFQPMVPDNRDILISGSAWVKDDTKEVVSESNGQHLSCYAGGMVGLGAKMFDHSEHMNMARKLVDGCIWTYDNMPSGIMPERFGMVACEMNAECNWDEKIWRQGVLSRAQRPEDDDGNLSNMTDTQLIDWQIKTKHLKPGFADINDPRYLLRPEAIESVFVHYRLSGEFDLLDAAWRMFEAIDNQTKTEYANAAIQDVTVENSEKENKMESFWLAETLKYFFLIFSEPSVVSLDDYVL